jgi:hypothetical protein
MDADPHQIRALARHVREQGEDVHAEADALVARCRAVGWTGVSGAAMVGRAVTHAHVLRRIAALHAAAACALDVHATAVDEALTLIAEIERRVHTAMDGARSRLKRFLAGLIDAVDPHDEALAAFAPPPPGSPLWLEVRLPGLALPALPLPGPR